MPPTRETVVANTTYYAVIVVTGLVGCIAYTSGATVEGALIRAIVTLLVCVALGYALNILWWLTGQDAPPDAARRESGCASGEAGKNVNYVVGDEPGGERTPAAAGGR